VKERSKRRDRQTEEGRKTDTEEERILWYRKGRGEGKVESGEWRET